MPNVVKGSKQERMVVVPHRPRQRVMFTLVLLGGVMVSTLGGWAYGYYTMLLTQQTEQAAREDLITELETVQTENADLRRQLAVLDRASIMDQRANEEVQSTIRTLRERVGQLEKDVMFYRQVVSEDTQDTGLMIATLGIGATALPERFSYKLVMRQEDADGDTFLTGYVNFNIVGTLNNEQVIYPLHEISENEEQLDILLRFKYFKNIEGELALPEGFKPDRIQITAVSAEPVEKIVNQDFRWIVQSN